MLSVRGGYYLQVNLGIFKMVHGLCHGGGKLGGSGMCSLLRIVHKQINFVIYVATGKQGPSDFLIGGGERCNPC